MSARRVVAASRAAAVATQQLLKPKPTADVVLMIDGEQVTIRDVIRDVIKDA